MSDRDGSGESRPPKAQPGAWPIFALDERVAKALELCRDMPDHHEVVEILEAHVSHRSAVGGGSDLVGRERSYGFVYLARGHPGEFKIGRTNLVDRRLAEVGATFPVELDLIHEIKTDDPAGVEAYWHRRFADKRLRGEWFRLSSGDVAAFRS